jgi:hypothetical protein
VIANGLKYSRDAFEKPAAIVMDRAQAAVPRFRAVRDGPTENRGEALKTEAHAEYRYVRVEKDLTTDAEVARVIGVPGAWRENHSVWRKIQKLIPRQFVVAYDDGWNSSDGPFELIEVVGEGILIVDDQDFHRRHNRSSIVAGGNRGTGPLFRHAK